MWLLKVLSYFFGAARFVGQIKEPTRLKFVGDSSAIRRRFVGESRRCALSYFFEMLRVLPRLSADYVTSFRCERGQPTQFSQKVWERTARFVANKSPTNRQQIADESPTNRQQKYELYRSTWRQHYATALICSAYNRFSITVTIILNDIEWYWMKLNYYYRTSARAQICVVYHDAWLISKN